MSLSRRCLAVSEDGAIETLEDRVDNWFRSDIVDFFLGRLHVEYSVKVEVVLYR